MNEIVRRFTEAVRRSLELAHEDRALATLDQKLLHAPPSWSALLGLALHGLRPTRSQSPVMVPAVQSATDRRPFGILTTYHTVRGDGNGPTELITQRVRTRKGRFESYSLH